MDPDEIDFEPDPVDAIDFEAEVVPAGVPPESTSALPPAHRETGTRELVLPETTFEADARRPRRSRTTVADGPATEVREVAPMLEGQRAAAPVGERTIPQRLRAYMSGDDPNAFGTQAIAEPRAPISIGGVEEPSLPSLSRAVQTWRRPGSGVSDVLSALLPTAERPEGMSDTAPDLRLQAGLRNALSGYGWADELAPSAGWLRGESGGDDADEQMRRLRTMASEQAPGSAALGSVAESIPLMAIPGSMPTLGGRMAVAGAQGLGIGAIRGLGESERGGNAALLDSLAGGAMEGLASAGTLGVGEGAVVPALRGAGRWLSSGRLGETAARMRNAASGVRYASELDRVDDPVAFAETVRRTGISRGLRSTPAAAERATGVRRAANAEITRLVDEAEAAAEAARGSGAYREGAPVPGTASLESMRTRLGEIRDGFTGQGAPAVSARGAIDSLLLGQPGHHGRVGGYAQTYPDGTIPIDALMDDWRALGNPANFREGQPWATLASANRDLRRAFRGLIEDAMESASGPEARAQLARALEEVHVGRTVERGARRTMDRRSGNRLLSLTDYLAAGSGATAGMVSGNPIVGVGTAAAAAIGNRAVRGREHAIGATALEALAPRLRAMGPHFERAAATLEGAAQRGSTALAIAHASLQRTNPVYRRAIEEMGDGAAETDDEQEESR